MRPKVGKKVIGANLPTLVVRKMDLQLSPTSFTSRSQFVHYCVAKELAARGESFDEMILGSPWWPEKS